MTINCLKLLRKVASVQKKAGKDVLDYVAGPQTPWGKLFGTDTTPPGGTKSQWPDDENYRIAEQHIVNNERKNGATPEGALYSAGFKLSALKDRIARAKQGLPPRNQFRRLFNL